MLGFGQKTKKQEKKEAKEMKERKIRKQKRKNYLKALKKKAYMEMIWEDRENRIWDRRENEPRIEESGWERERILRGINVGRWLKDI